MEKIVRIISLAIVLLAFLACKKDEDVNIDITGEWHLESSDKIDIEENGIDVYISFLGNGRFEMYQKISAGRYRYYGGNYTVTGNSVDGTYSDGTPWGGSYVVSFDGDLMVMTSITVSSGEETEVCTYSRSDIPDEVISGSVEFRSAGNGDDSGRWL